MEWSEISSLVLIFAVIGVYSYFQHRNDAVRERYELALKIAKHYGDTEISLFRFFDKDGEDESCVWALVNFNGRTDDASNLIAHGDYWVLEKWTGSVKKYKEKREQQVRELLRLLPYEIHIIDAKIPFRGYESAVIKRRERAYESAIAKMQEKRSSGESPSLILRAWGKAYIEKLAQERAEEQQDLAEARTQGARINLWHMEFSPENTLEAEAKMQREFAAAGSDEERASILSKGVPDVLKRIFDAGHLDEASEETLDAYHALCRRYGVSP